MMISECAEGEDLVSLGRMERWSGGGFLSTPWVEASGSCFVPPVEVLENTDGYKVYIELPGVESQAIHMTFQKDQLTVRGEKKRPAGEKEDCNCSERCYGAFERIVAISSMVDSRKASARFTNGVLEVSLPKREEAKPKTVEIETA